MKNRKALLLNLVGYIFKKLVYAIVEKISSKPGYISCLKYNGNPMTTVTSFIQEISISK